jgi:DNA adenine methylase
MTSTRTKGIAIQAPLWEDAAPTPVVNVASVPQRSPFRYPGGKTWLVPRIRHWLGSVGVQPTEFIEPFAGGAIVGLTVAFEQLADRVILVERDEDVAAVWETIINTQDGGEWLADRIVNFHLSPESVSMLLSSSARTTKERAFRTIVRNRISHGGILAPGAGALKHGENGRGILSRWYPETLEKRVLDIAHIRERIKFIRGDGFQTIRDNASHTGAMFFLDPPYTASSKRAGSRLYKYHEVDHRELFRLARQIEGGFLMTYDDAEEVRSLALEHRLETRLVAMSNTHHATMNELLIGRNLDWAR